MWASDLFRYYKDESHINAVAILLRSYEADPSQINITVYIFLIINRKGVEKF